MLISKKTAIMLVLYLLLACMLFTACSGTPTAAGSGEQTGAAGANAAADNGNAVAGDNVNAATGVPAIEAIAKEDNDAIKKVLADYVTALYSSDIAGYSSSSATGSIPENIKPFIAKRTVDEAEGNPEIGVHLPRYVALNGVTLIGYEVLSYKGADGTKKPEIESSYVEKRGDAWLYFVKVGLKAKCVPDELFDQAYVLNPANNIYDATGAINDELTDIIKVQAQYDAVVVKEGDGFKVLQATELSMNPGYKNRLLKTNNSFIQKMPYLSAAGVVSADAHADEADTAVYEKEKALVTDFFNRLKIFDSSRMTLLATYWKKTQGDFEQFIDKIDSEAAGNADSGVGKAGRLLDIMNIRGDYKTKFDIESFPTVIYLEKINNIENLSIMPHPSYSRKNKAYIVKFDVSAQGINNAAGSDVKYRFDYFVTLTESADALKISSIKLNEYYNLKS